MADATPRAGWVTFAGAVMLVSGWVNVIEGFVALVKRSLVVVIADRLYLIDLRAWGWTLLLFGVAFVGAGTGLVLGQGWARILAIVLVGIHAVVQVLWLGAYPLWSLLMIGFDIIVLYALIAQWKPDADEVPMGRHSSAAEELAASGAPVGEYGHRPA